MRRDPAASHVFYWRVPPGLLILFDGGDAGACQALKRRGLLRENAAQISHALFYGYALTAQGEALIQEQPPADLVIAPPLTMTAQVLAVRAADLSVTLTELAALLEIELEQVTQIIARRRRRGTPVPRGTSTSKGHTWKHTPRKKQFTVEE